MARHSIDSNADEALQRMFEAAQDLQRRIYRVGRRGFIAQHATFEMQNNARAIMQAANDIVEIVSGVTA